MKKSILLSICFWFLYANNSDEIPKIDYLDIAKSKSLLASTLHRFDSLYQSINILLAKSIQSMASKDEILRLDSLITSEYSELEVELYNIHSNLNIYKNSNEKVINHLKESIQLFDSDLIAIRRILVEKNTLLSLQLDSLQDDFTAYEDTYKAGIAKVNERMKDQSISISQVDKQSWKQFKILDKSINYNLLYLLGVFIVIVLIILLTYIILKKRIQYQHDSINSLRSIQEQIEKKSVDLDAKLTDVIELQLRDFKNNSVDQELHGHSLPIKLYEEIHRMRNRLKSMEDSHGIKVLSKRLESLEDQLKQMGYAIIDLVGRKYEDGMELEKVSFVHDETLHDGERIITRVIKPHVTFNNTLLKPAEVEVSQGDKN